MSSMAIAGLVFACTSLAALGGLFLNARLPEHHLDAHSTDVIKLVMGLIATIAGLVLGLLISSAHRSYDAQEAEVQQLGIHLFQLDRTLERLGEDAGEARKLLYRIVSTELELATSKNGTNLAQNMPLQAQREMADLFEKVAALSPKTDSQRFMQGQALRLLAALGDTRLLLSEQARGSVSWPLLVVLVFWLTVLFVGFGLFGRRNGTVVAALLLGAISVAGAIFLILELNRPYGGTIQVSLVPIRNAVTQMTR